MQKGLYLLVFMLVFYGSPALGKSWYGAHVGSEVHGKKILESQMMAYTAFYAPTGNFTAIEEVTKLSNYCREKLKGAAVVNVRFEISVGQASERNEKGGGITTYTPALTYVIYADCVTKLR